MGTFQGFSQGKWSHVLRWPVMPLGATLGQPPLLSWEGMVSPKKGLLGDGAFWKEELCHLK